MLGGVTPCAQRPDPPADLILCCFGCLLVLWAILRGEGAGAPRGYSAAWISWLHKAQCCSFTVGTEPVDSALQTVPASQHSCSPGLRSNNEVLSSLFLSTRGPYGCCLPDFISC